MIRIWSMQALSYRNNGRDRCDVQDGLATHGQGLCAVFKQLTSQQLGSRLCLLAKSSAHPTRLDHFFSASLEPSFVHKGGVLSETVRTAGVPSRCRKTRATNARGRRRTRRASWGS